GMSRRSGPIPIQPFANQQSGRFTAAPAAPAAPTPATGRQTEPVAVPPPPQGALQPAPLPPPPAAEPLPPVWGDTSDSTIDEPATQVGSPAGFGAAVPQEA